MRYEITQTTVVVLAVVEGIMRLLRSGHPGPMNIGNPHEVPVLHVTETIRRLVVSQSEIVHPEADRRPAGRLVR